MTNAEVKRFDLGSDPWEEGAAGMEESERGDYVLFSDHEAQLAEAQRERGALRTMLAFAYAAAHPSEGALYGDDGELQFGGFPYPLDFRRDTVDELRAKIDARGMARFAKQLKDAAQERT